MAIFNSYVSLPEGNIVDIRWPGYPIHLPWSLASWGPGRPTAKNFFPLVPPGFLLVMEHVRKTTLIINLKAYKPPISKVIMIYC
jgi:hypothetical protein